MQQAIINQTAGGKPKVEEIKLRNKICTFLNNRLSEKSDPKSIHN
jgi:hypothetical protein